MASVKLKRVLIFDKLHGILCECV